MLRALENALRRSAFDWLQVVSEFRWGEPSNIGIVSVAMRGVLEWTTYKARTHVGVVVLLSQARCYCSVMKIAPRGCCWLLNSTI